MNNIIRINALLSMIVLLLVSTSSYSVTWPDTPLNVSVHERPMTLIVASRDQKLYYEAYNDASDIDGDGTLDIRFKPSIIYYGLFDSSLCYTYSSQLFSPSSQTNDGTCSGGGEWSGNWLNYVTTTRIDALRKVLYGGHREVDSDSDTILRRAYFPQDAHSWAKEYVNPTVDGYSISQYTPLSNPAGGKRHLIGGVTMNWSADCSRLDACSDMPPLLSVVTNTDNRPWHWASKERPVMDTRHGGQRTNYTVRVRVCTQAFNDGCKQYPNGSYKPIGLLHEYGEDETMLFGLLTGSYDQNMSGGVLRKPVSSFKNEINPLTGQFTGSSSIVRNLDRLRIRDFGNGKRGIYKGGWLETHPMSADPNKHRFPDWGNPVGEMMYEGLRYFAGKGRPTGVFSSSDRIDKEVGLTRSGWDDPYSDSGAAKAKSCSKPNMLVVSDTNPSFDSDEVPGSFFNKGFPSDLPGLDAEALGTKISNEERIRGRYFIGQSNHENDFSPTIKNVSSLGRIRGLSPEEPVLNGSYNSASVAYYGKTNDISGIEGEQTVDSFFVALASPLPRIEFELKGGLVSLVPFAKTVGGRYAITNPIIDFYIQSFANMLGAPKNSNINGGRPYAVFRINFEGSEQGADLDMDAVALYQIKVLENGQLEVTVISEDGVGRSKHHIGYVISGTTSDGTYLVVRDLDTSPESDVDYHLDVPNNSDPLPLRSTRVFESGGGSVALLKNPLWYAAKWGGFIDRNGNNKPDLQSEWDENNDGNPDNYFYVQNPLKLKDSLRRTLDNIVARSGDAGNITANSSSINTGTLIFQSTYNTAAWSGDLVAYEVTEEGVSEREKFRASENIPSYARRNIFTSSDGAAISFQWSNLSAEDRGALGSRSILDYIRGKRGDEMQNGGDFRDREVSNVLGDIVHSSNHYEKDADTVYVGANDGMLHGFDAKSGKELFAYVPSALIPKLVNLTDPLYLHDYFVDGEIVVSNKAQTNSNILVATLGHGGKGLFGLNVTNPDNFRASDVLWEYFDEADDDLGYMLGRPVIAKMNNDQWAVIVANGYDSASGTAALYIFNMETGAIIKKINTQKAGDNGLSSPGVFDANNDGTVDFIYAGDLKGNVWKFDVTGSVSEWGLAITSGGSERPIFEAKDSNGEPQPITAPISVAVNDHAADVNYGKRFLFFGTGSYFQLSDPSNTQQQTWYGLIDPDPDGGKAIEGRNSLKPRAIVIDGEEFDGKPVRVFEKSERGDMEGKEGWYIDFSTHQGERMVTASKYYRLAIHVLVASSIIPVDEPCSAGGTGFVNLVNPFTGTRLRKGIIDVNGNADFSDDIIGKGEYIGGVDLGIGMPGEPVLIGDILILGGSTGEIAEMRTGSEDTGKLQGRISWREIIRD